MLNIYLLLKRSLRSMLFVWTVVAVSSLADYPAAAQTVELTGHVRDQQGRPIEGASVIATSTATPSIETATDITGQYRFQSLNEGIYAITITMAGFQNELRQGVRVGPNAVTTVDVELAVGGFSQQVDVVGVTPLSGTGIDPDHIPAIISSISATEIRERHTVSLADALQEQLGAVSIEGTTANLFQPSDFVDSRRLRSLVYRRESPSIKTAFESTNRSVILCSLISSLSLHLSGYN